MTARSFLVRGLLVGLLAGIATFLVAHTVGEPSVERAIALEETTAPAAAGHSHAEGADDHHDEASTAGSDQQSGHSHEEGEALVSRSTQSTWGLLTGTLAVSLALGGILALVAAATVGRLGRAGAAQTTAIVALIGFVAFALVPFVKYPANPPAVGSADTIGERTGYYFLFVLVSLVVAIAATVLALKVRASRGTYAGLLAGVGAYLLVVVAVGQLLPSVDELGDFPASTLWSFRLASLITLATMWGVLGVGLSGLVGRLWKQDLAVSERRALAASL